jgi:hypothetical protein
MFLPFDFEHPRWRLIQYCAMYTKLGINVFIIFLITFLSIQNVRHFNMYLFYLSKIAKNYRTEHLIIFYDFLSILKSTKTFCILRKVIKNIIKTLISNFVYMAHFWINRHRGCSKSKGRNIQTYINPLFTYNTLEWVSDCCLTPTQTDRHVTPLGHIILIPSPPDFALSP